MTNVDKKVLVLVGMPGAGKSFCVEHLHEQGTPSVYFGGVVVDEARRRYGETNEKYEKEIREEFREVDGKGAIAKRIIPKIHELFKTHDRVVADGLYSWTEYKLFKEEFGKNALIVAIAAPRHLRHERLARRPVRPLTEEEVTSREFAEIENLEKGGPIANADYTIVNDEDPYKLIERLEHILTQTDFI
jgi:dephospho-CoA kinase